jgi:UDP-sugar diphosphatase
MRAGACRLAHRQATPAMASSAAAVADPATTHPALYPHGLTSLSAGTHPTCTAPAILARLTAPVAGPLPASGSAFVCPRALAYSLDALPKRWDMVVAHASVGILLHHTGLDAVLVVRQFRPAVWECVRAEEAAAATSAAGVGGGSDASALGAAAPPPHPPPPPALSAGLTFELCAGILDKPALSARAVAAEEVAEECGFGVDPGALEEVASFRTAIGISGAPHTIFYAAVTDDDRLPPGAGVGGGVGGEEAIETLALPWAGVAAFLADPALARSAGLMYALAWLAARRGGAAARGGGG